MDTSEEKRAAVEAFDDYAEAYVDSAVHRTGDDLDLLANWCADADLALDVAAGAGHTAGAVREAGVDRVVATDGAPSMVATALESFDGLDGVVADAEVLPFADDAFDAVSCRIAAHHFPEPPAFLVSVARILEPGGTFAFEDNVTPAAATLDDFLNRVERLRDPTHVRSHTVDEWREWIETAGFTIESVRMTTRTIEYDDWVAQLDTSAADREELEALFADPPGDARDAFGITEEDGTVSTFESPKLLLRATR